MADERQREYQKRYDKKTKMISVKYALSEMEDYDRFMEYLEKTGRSANGFIKELINDFFEKEKYVLNDKKIADYFTITNTGLKTFDFRITINSKSKNKHFYYTTDDIKWAKSTEDLTV